MAVSLRKTYATAAVLAELNAIADRATEAALSARIGATADASRRTRALNNRIAALATTAHPAVTRAYVATAAVATRRAGR